ncbi:hypothetical protein HDF18_24640 [Mucilaginibacter sp. X5P1]|uniref:hypothetical protein n=1 Tax=Mucilaginibacter sp. X5P1 TaxID=2723088 RepID=UPI00161BA251|nr:hypothetical protein [Mucilaginibacter sp. X5P1]MBB6141448.1 hypothetical protein [Mucilaginibacter sp. X5P1]
MNIKLTLITLLWAFLVLNANAQITIVDARKLDNIRNGTTYVMVKNVNFPDANRYLSALQENWTLTKNIRLLSGNDPDVNISPGDSFLSLEATYVTENNTTNIYYYLCFWTCKDKFFKKDRALKQSDEDPIACIALSVSPEAFISRSFSKIRDFFNDMDFDGGGALYNWSPGMLKNYMQQLTILLCAGKKIKAYDDITNKEQLPELANSTLYLPDFNFIKYNTFVGNDTGTYDASNVLADYHAPYKVVTKKGLDSLILNENKPIYYLLFIKDSSSKIVCVINSGTGETIYSRHTSLSFNLKSGDLKDLYKTMSKL